MNNQILDQNLALLVGQAQAKQLLAKYLTADSCSAYLLVGPPHVGKGWLARLMAASWHGESDFHKIHPDTVVFEDILVKNSSENDENQWKRSVDDFVHAIYLSPVASSRKIGIVENIDRFSPQALNALLKTLEEPPPRAMLILTAQDVANILPTILSRVQMIRLHYLSNAEMQEYLSGKQAVNIPEITLLSNGAVGLANRLMQDKSFYDKSLAGINSFQTLLQKDIPQMLRIANIKEREEAIELVQIWLNLARRALLGELKEVSSLAEITKNYTSADWVKLIDRLNLALVALDANANVRVTMEATLLSVV